MYRVDLLSDIVLFRLYEKYVSSDEELNLSIGEISQLFSERIALNLIRSAIETNRRGSERTRFIRRTGTKGNFKYNISLTGVAKVQDELRRSSSPIAYYSTDPARNLEAVAGIHTNFMTGAERADSETWKPLPIDRESPDFIEMRSSVIEAIETIEKDNGFAAHYPEERAGILQTLHNGLEWISKMSPTMAQIQASLLAPLVWIITKFADGIIVEVAKKAATKIVDWLMTMS